MGMQKVVIRVPMKDAKNRTKALRIAVGLPGVMSASIEGIDKDRIVVIGDIDSVRLTMMLRKQMRSAELVIVSSLDNKEKEKEKEKEKNKERGGGQMVQMWPCTPAYYFSPYPCAYVAQDPNPSCMIM